MNTKPIDQDRRREGDAENGGGRANGCRATLRQHHPPGGAETARDARRSKTSVDSAAAPRGRMASAGGTRTARRTAEKAPAAAAPSVRTPRPARHPADAEEQLGKAEELVVEVADGASEPGAAATPMTTRRRRR